MGNLPNVLSADLHPFRVTTSLATNTGAQKTSGQTNTRARPHQGDADFCAGGASGYSCFIPPGAPSRPWQLIRTPSRGFFPWRFSDRAAARGEMFVTAGVRKPSQRPLHLRRSPHPMHPRYLPTYRGVQLGSLGRISGRGRSVSAPGSPGDTSD
jgi:hypothetical protein